MSHALADGWRTADLDGDGPAVDDARLQATPCSS